MTRPETKASETMPSRPQPRTRLSQSDPLTDQLSKLGRLLDHETAMLGAGRLTDMTSFIQNKSMILLQLDTHQVPLEPGAPAALRHELVALRGQLARNHAALRLNIRALQELNELVAERYREADSDGTYSMYRR